MDHNRVAARRSTIFQRIHLELTQSSVIKNKISPGKFPTSGVGILQVVAILLLIGGVICFLSIRTCPKTSIWYEWLFTTATCSCAIVTLFFYSIFTFGIATQHPRFWFTSDIGLCTLTSIFAIVASILSMTDCTYTDTKYRVPPSLGVSGAGVLIIASAALYIMYRNKEETVLTSRRFTHKIKPEVISMA